VKYNTEIISK